MSNNLRKIANLQKRISSQAPSSKKSFKELFVLQQLFSFQSGTEQQTPQKSQKALKILGLKKITNLKQAFEAFEHINKENSLKPEWNDLFKPKIQLNPCKLSKKIRVLN